MVSNEVTVREVGTGSPHVWSDKIVLVVEDIELNYLYIKELINPTGAMILRAENGRIAVELCKNNPNIDVVLMDLLMPVMNGYEATKQIKVLRPELPIIAQTAYAMADDRRKAMEAGCDDFIAKPIGKEELLRKVQFFFQKK
jgi:two-component system, cell cycle response regulator DivK